MSTTMKVPEAEKILSGRGWFQPFNSRKEHAFEQDSRSLCGKWFVPFLPDDLPPINSPATSSECAECARKVRQALTATGQEVADHG